MPTIETRTATRRSDRGARRRPARADDLRREARPARARSGRSRSSAAHGSTRPGWRALAATGSARSPGSPARRTCARSRSPRPPTRSSATSSRRRAWGSRRSSTRSASTASRLGGAVLPAVDRRRRELRPGRSSTAMADDDPPADAPDRRAARARARSSTSPATRAGAGSRRPTARTRISRPRSGCAYIRGPPGPRPRRRASLATGKHMVGHGLAEGGLNQAPAHIGRARAARRAAVPVRGGRPRVAGIGERDAGLLRRGRRAVPRLARAAHRRSCATSGASTASSRRTTSASRCSSTAHQLTADLGEAAAAGARGRRRRRAAAHRRLRRAARDRASRTGGSTRRRSTPAVARVLRMKFRLGLFEQPYVDVHDEAVARRAGRRRGAGRPRRSPRARSSWSRTTGSCRSPPDRGRVAVIGPIADSARDLLGDYSHLVHMETLREMRERRRTRSGSSARAT